MKKQQITPKKSDKNSQSFRKIAMFSSVGLIFASLGLLIWVDSNNSENFAKSMQQTDLTKRIIRTFLLMKMGI